MNADSKPAAPAAAASPEAFSFWRAFGRHWQSSVRYYGLRHTIAQVAQATRRFLREYLPGHHKAKYGDLDYDFDHNVDTTRANVGFRSQLIAALSGHQYFPSEPWLFEEIMQALQLSVQQSAAGAQQAAASGKIVAQAGLQDFAFIDLGSGKGRALLMAAPYGFKKIIGVEYMPEWHRVAQENIRKYAERCTPAHTGEMCGTGTGVPSRRDFVGWGGGTPACAIESLCMDARDFDFPAAPLIIYMFNPFPEPVLAMVLDHLRQSILQNPRRVFVAYRYLEFEHLLQRCGWLEKIEGTEQWALWENRRNRA